MESVQPLHESLVKKFTDSTLPNAVVVLFNENDVKVTSQMISYDLKVGGSVGLLAKVDPVTKKAMADEGLVSTLQVIYQLKKSSLKKQFIFLQIPDVLTKL